MQDPTTNLEGAVLLGQPAPSITLEDLTVVDLVGLAFTRIKTATEAAGRSSAGREYNLAITHLEDAVMRFNRGRSMELGCFHISDLEDPAFLHELQQLVESEPTTEGDAP